MRNLLLAGVAVGFVFAAAEAQAVQINALDTVAYSSDGTGTLSYPSATEVDFTYGEGYNGFANSWSISGVATQTGAITVNYDSSGFYAFYAVSASLTQTDANGTTTLYAAGPADCCSTPSNGFDYTGTTTLDIVAGQPFSFGIAGSNFDTNDTVEGTLKLTEVSFSAVPEPISMALLGSGLVGTALLRRRRTV